MGKEHTSPHRGLLRAMLGCTSEVYTLGHYANGADL